MRRRLALITSVVLLLGWMLAVAEVSAKSGGGGFRSGGRATREDDRGGVQSAPDTDTWDAPAPDEPPKRLRAPRSWRSTVKRFVTGGLIGSVFFGRSFAGIGLFEVVVISGLIAGAYWALARYQLDAAGQYAPAGAYGGGSGVLGTGAAVAPADEGPDALARGLADIREADPTFDDASFAEAVGDIFRRVQAAWTAGDMAQAADVLTVEMRGRLEAEAARLRAAGRVNRVERITLRRVAVVLARQHGGWDRVAVEIGATLVDYTTNETGLKVLEGNPFEPVPFRERWELIRPSGAHPWRVNAIQ